jgi:sterol desaturase/sphingolipid hydroxylase (fatty acid hydroxylase superfamily)
MVAFWIVLGFLVGSLVEWTAHKYFLHNRRFSAAFKSHFSVHHRNSRKNNGHDAMYFDFPPNSWEEGASEIVYLLVIWLVSLPSYFISPWLCLTLTFHAAAYYFLHRKFHLRPTWGRRWMPWHWDHHMGPDQNCNWGVTSPIFDILLGTRRSSKDL